MTSYNRDQEWNNFLAWYNTDGSLFLKDRAKAWPMWYSLRAHKFVEYRDLVPFGTVP